MKYNTTNDLKNKTTSQHVAPTIHLTYCTKLEGKFCIAVCTIKW